MVKLKNLAQSRTGKGFHLFLVRNWEKVSEAGGRRVTVFEIVQQWPIITISSSCWGLREGALPQREPDWIQTPAVKLVVS